MYWSNRKEGPKPKVFLMNGEKFLRGSPWLPATGPLDVIKMPSNADWRFDVEGK